MANRTLKQLLDAAVFRQEYWRGSINDFGTLKTAMTFVGAPTWSRENGVATLASSAGKRVTSNGAIASIVNTTQPFFAEMLVEPVGLDYLLYHVNAGGWTWYYDLANARVQIFTYTNAVTNARLLTAPVGSVPSSAFVHLVGYLDPVGLTGQWWIRGVPVTSAFTNTAPPVVCTASVFAMPGVGSASARTILARVWQGSITNDEVSTLYQASKTLVTS